MHQSTQRPALPTSWEGWGLFVPWEDMTREMKATSPHQKTWTRAKAARVVKVLNTALQQKADQFEHLHDQLGELDDTVDSDDINEVLDSALTLTNDYESGLHDSEPMETVREWLGEFTELLNHT